MNKLKNIGINQVTKLSIIVGILLVSFSFFYYYVIFLPQKEEAGLEQQRQEQLVRDEWEQQASDQELQEKKEAEKALFTCLADAEEDYHNQWYKECKRQDKLTNRCISLYEMTLDEYAEQNNIPDDLSNEQFEALSDEALSDWYDKQIEALNDFDDEKDECLCRLPEEYSDRINQQEQDDKNECFKKYPQTKPNPHSMDDFNNFLDGWEFLEEYGQN